MIKYNPLDHFYYESPDGRRYYFDGKVKAQSGIGIIPIKFIEDYGPQQDGSTLRDWRMNPRTIELDIFLQGEMCCGTRGEQLAELINIIRPNRGTSRDVPGWLRFFNDSVTLMEIPVHILQGPNGNFKYNGEIGKYQVEDGIQFYAADPVWREYDKVVNSTLFQELTSCLDDCLTFADEATSTSLCLVATTYAYFNVPIIYTGTWDADQIDIIITGPIDNPIISNQTLGTTIELQYNVPSDGSVIITIRPEYVLVEDNLGNNLIGTVTSISDLVDFVLKCPGQITPTGENVITLFGENTAVETTRIDLEYWIRHISAYGSPDTCDIGKGAEELL